jgi:hypothetical protein
VSIPLIHIKSLSGGLKDWIATVLWPCRTPGFGKANHFWPLEWLALLQDEFFNQDKDNSNQEHKHRNFIDSVHHPQLKLVCGWGSFFRKK